MESAVGCTDQVGGLELGSVMAVGGMGRGSTFTGSFADLGIV